MESYIRSQMFPEERHDFIDDLDLAFEMPLTIGFDVRSPMIFAGLLTGVRKAIENTLPGAFDWAPMDKPYKGTTIVRIKTNGERLERRAHRPRWPSAQSDVLLRPRRRQLLHQLQGSPHQGPDRPQRCLEGFEGDRCVRDQ